MKCKGDDEWYSGSILRRLEKPIPHTELKIVSFIVSYNRASDGSDAQQLEIEEEIKSDRIRLKANAEGIVLTVPTDSQTHQYTAPIDSNTGIDKSIGVKRVIQSLKRSCYLLPGVGMWQTVSVREVDEEKEREESERIREEMIAGKHFHQSSKGSSSRNDSHGSDDDIDPFDPYGRVKTTQRGIKLYEDAERKHKVNHTNLSIFQEYDP